MGTEMQPGGSLMAECTCILTCPFYNDRMRDMPGIADLLKNNYCQGNYENCARYLVRSKLGRDNVPGDLFPNQADRVKSIIDLQ
jgi:hypothetical protein